MFAVAYSPALHLENQHQETLTEHFDNHETKHHNLIELAQLALTASDGAVDDNHEHPNCDQSSHQNHCHHTCLVYIDLQNTLSLAAQVKNITQPYHITFSSRVSSPNFRPPVI